MSLTDIDEAMLIERAKEGDREAFDELYRRYDSQVYRSICRRTTNDTDAQHIAQDTRNKVWEKFRLYDPHRASFFVFAGVWADSVRCKYFKDQKIRWRREIPFTALVSRSLDFEHDKEIGEILARISGDMGQSVEELLTCISEERRRAMWYEELLCLTFNGSSPPHQLLAFGFVKLLEWPPRRVVAEISDLSLREIEGKLGTAYLQVSQLPEDHVVPCFQQLRENLKRTFGEGVKEKKTLDTYPLLLDRILGDTLLKEYYTGATAELQAQNVVNWWNAVTKRVRKAAHGLW